MYSKILVVNRGLIQANCVRAIQELGSQAITIYEPEDRNSAGVRNADEAYEIQSSSSTRAYDDINQIVQFAAALKVDAVLPGYGFLAQNAEFSKQLRKNGIVTIGPDLEGVHNLADKPTIKQTAIDMGLYVLPGSENLGDLKQVNQAAEHIGYPLLIKAANSYGGKGLRVVEREEELKAAYDYILSQCEKYSMNSKDVYLEKYFPHAHHIEFPVLRDQNGNTAVFPEQWCSVQRRFQKQLVETPSRILTAEKRNKLKSVIQRLINKLNIKGFASVAFLVDEDHAYFLKVNGYVQPFYTVTSFLTGIDLLKEQIRIFSGDPLRFKSEQIKKNGHVIGVSICAEDPDHNFAPSPGTIDRFYLPFGQGVSVQTNVFSGDTVATFYDPMIAKLVVRDTTRKEAVSKLKIALDDLYVDGITTNIPLLRAVLNSKEFRRRKMDLSFISSPENRHRIFEELKTDENHEIAALIAALDLFTDTNSQQILETARQNLRGTLWQAASRWLSQKKLPI